MGSLAGASRRSSWCILVPFLFWLRASAYDELSSSTSSSSFVPSTSATTIRKLGLKKHDNKSRFPEYPHLGGAYPYPAPVPIPYPVPVPVPTEKSEEETSEEPERHDRRPSRPEYVKDEVVVTSEPQYKCHEGFTLQHGKCVRYDRKETKLGCRQGWQFSDGMCVGVDVEPSKRMCNEGFTDDEKDGCVKGFRAPRQVLCPEGFQIGKEKCFRDVHTKPDSECPPDYQFVGDECYQRKEVVARGVCQEGFELKKGSCRRVRYQPGSRHCSVGYSLSDKGCAKIVSMSPLTTCPEGFQLDGEKCVFRKTMEARAQCSPDANLEGGMCLRRFSQKPLLECPQGSGSKTGGVGNECYTESYAAAEKYCRYGHLDSKSKMCMGKMRSEPVEYRCPFGYLPVDKHSCMRKQRKPTERRCPAGLELDYKSSMCVSVEREHPEYVCPKHFSSIGADNTCTMMETADKKEGCEPGFRFNARSRVCQRSEYTAPQHKCEPGYSPSANGNCMKVEVMQPDPHCPPGFEATQAAPDINRHGMSTGVTVCVGASRLDVTYSCPPQYELQHMDKKNKQTCAGREQVDPRLECPPNFEADPNGKCMRYESQAPRAVCGEGYKVVAGQCLKHIHEEPVVMCPRGYKLYDGTCVNRLLSKPKAVCPREYVFDHLVRQCYKVEVKYGFKKQALEEDILDLELPARTTPEPKEEILDEVYYPTPQPREPPRVAVQPVVFPRPQTVQIIQQRVPIPAPVVYHHCLLSISIIISILLYIIPASFLTCISASCRLHAWPPPKLSDQSQMDGEIVLVCHINCWLGRNASSHLTGLVCQMKNPRPVRAAVYIINIIPRTRSPSPPQPLWHTHTIAFRLVPCRTSCCTFRNSLCQESTVGPQTLAASRRKKAGRKNRV
eukprot:GHVS01066165.1.p1 GENE.GHVS01066165.1~~GHVS01066165.1.p1  ORF type:complete len:894 (+),score=100.11 GHVS01066165.1:298-2979(+)